ncbi:MAG TPA: hypothetical protein VMY42_07120 [Thermoguttaceae bacterium]|nr:hypothetical protein [Thermoguttaceae bacterium]
MVVVFIGVSSGQQVKNLFNVPSTHTFFKVANTRYAAMHLIALSTNRAGTAGRTSIRGGTMGEPLVNFDGWQTMRFLLPGNYPSPNDKLHWPGNADWQGTTGAAAQPAEDIVYPLKLTKVIVAMRPEILYVEGRAFPELVIHLERLVVLPPPEGM